MILKIQIKKALILQEKIKILRFLIKILRDFCSDTEVHLEPYPYANILFLNIITENFVCKNEDYKASETNEDQKIDLNNICENPFNDTIFKKVLSKAFSTRNISPLVSDLYSLRYGDDNTNCFVLDNTPITIQIIGHLNNYAKIAKYKDAYHDTLIYGGIIDLYCKYDDDFKTFVICLDNSNFFNSVIQDEHKSRAIFRWKPSKLTDNFGQENKETLTELAILNAFILENKVSIINEFVPNVTNNSKIKNEIIIKQNLYDALLEFKKMKEHRHLNYYGSFNDRIFMSTTGILRNTNNAEVVKK